MENKEKKAEVAGDDEDISTLIQITVDSQTYKFRAPSGLVEIRNALALPKLLLEDHQGLTVEPSRILTAGMYRGLFVEFSGVISR